MTLLLIHRANLELSQNHYMEHCRNSWTRGESVVDDANLAQGHPVPHRFPERDFHSRGQAAWKSWTPVA